MSTEHVSTPVHVAAAVLGDAWSVLIMREALLLGARRFGEFRDGLDVNRATLANRLNLLVEAGLLERQDAEPGSDRQAYVPTPRGEEYVGVLLSMLEWGRRWEVDPDEGELLIVRHQSCGARLSTVLTCQVCCGPIDPRGVALERPEFSVKRPPPHARHRMPDLDQLERARPCPIARCLATIGDRWSVLMVQEAFFGISEFDAFERRLGIAPNILSHRLNRLCERSVLVRRPSTTTSARHIYPLTEKGLDLYRVPAMLRQWAIKSMGVEDPLSLTHRWCGADLAIDVRCTRCGESADADSVLASLPRAT